MSTPTSTDPKAAGPAYAAKLILYIALAGLGAFQTAVAADNVVDTNDFILIALAILGAVGVYWAPENPTIKMGIAFGVAALQAVSNLLIGGLALESIQPADWIQVLFTAFAAIGVGLVPNKKSSYTTAA